MNTCFKPLFGRHLKKITDQTLRQGAIQAIKSVEEAKTKNDIPELKKLKGKKKKPIYYRIKVGDYRIGVTIENDLVTFANFRPRDKFYNFFP